MNGKQLTYGIWFTDEHPGWMRFDSGMIFSTPDIGVAQAQFDVMAAGSMERAVIAVFAADGSAAQTLEGKPLQ